LFNWAKFRTTKKAVKLHIKLNHAGYLPTFAIITTGKVHKQKIAPLIPLEKGDVTVFDRALTDFNWNTSLCHRGTYFVTYLKKNARYRIIERRDTKQLRNISSDWIIEFKDKKKMPYRLRPIRSKDPKTGKYIILLTNQFEWSAKKIALIYKERWQIKLFLRHSSSSSRLKVLLVLQRMLCCSNYGLH